MKKVLSFVLVLSMILGSFGMAFAAPADVVGKDYEDAVNALVELGVVAGYEDGSYRPENIVTRAEMATFIVKAMGLADYAVGKSAFTDMAGHWADAFVAYAASLGFVAGNTDGTFAPDATVSYDQAITMLVQALGYKGDYLVGGYPGAFVNQAKALGMLDGVKSGAAGANRGDVATLLFNTLGQPFVRYSVDGVLQVADGRTLPADSMMLRLDARLYNDGNAFVVKGNDAEDAVINMNEYQGAYVTAYMNTDEEIIAVKEVKSVFLTGDLDVDKDIFTLADDTEYKFDKITTAAIYEFTNGVFVDDTTTYGGLTSKTAVTVAADLSGKYITRLYSVAEWSGTTIMWDEDDAEAVKEETPFIRNAEFVLDKNDELDTDHFLLVGAESLEAIKEDSIVTYYTGNADATGDAEIVKVVVCTDVVEGKVTKSNSTGTKFTINGKVYEVAYATDAETDTVAVGKEGKFYLNAAGKIAVFEETEAKAGNYAIVTKQNAFGVGTAYADEDIMQIKMLTADGKESVFKYEEDYGKSVSTTSIYATSIAAYSVDKNGEIDDIYAVTDYAIGEGVELTAKNYLAGYPVAKNVVVFQAKAAGGFEVKTLADVPVKEALTGSRYALNDLETEIAVIVLAASVGDDAEGVYGVFTGVSKVENADEELVWEVAMFVDGAEKTYLSEKKANQITFPADQKLYTLTFAGTELSTAAAVEKTYGNDDLASVTVAAIKDGNLKLSSGSDYKEVASDVIVYKWDADKAEMTLSSFAKIAKGDAVALYELDGADDDKDGVDVIIFKAL